MTVSQVSGFQPLKRVFGVLALLILAAGVGVGFLVSSGLGGEREPALAAAIIGAAGLMGFLPLLVSDAAKFGLVVLGGSMGRLMLGLMVTLVLSQNEELTRRPLVLGVAAGLGLVLLLEAASAVVILNQAEKLKTAAAHAA